MSSPNNWVEAEELRKTRQTALVFGCIFGLASISFALIAAFDYDRILNDLGWDWDGLAALTKLVFPLWFARAAVQQFRLVRRNG